MCLSDMCLEKEYRNLKDDVVRDFYIPTLSKASSYKRASGFFSSTSLIEISKGIANLARNGGKIKLLTSPSLSDEDIKAMQLGYETREGYIHRAMIKSMFDHNEYYDRERLNLLASLIADGILDIKVALLSSQNGYGIYHEKFGIISDEDNNHIMFTGSMNESYTALKNNYESIDVFCSWEGDTDRIEIKENAFDLMWNNKDENIISLEIPKVKDEFIRRYKTGKPNYNIDELEFVKEDSTDYYLNPKEEENWIKKPDYLDDLYDYQKEAIINWEANSYRGIFDMATGTGKTLTALGGLSELSKSLDNNLVIIVVCPYQHLVEQWVEDIIACGVEPIKCYSKYNWKNDLPTYIRDFNYKIRKNLFLITTNMTFVTKFFQDSVDKINGNICLVVDEAHNFGTKRQAKCMKEIYNYRLALSATLERHHDEEGTQRLYDFFGKKCIEYSLDRAIEEDKLTRYLYYPIPINLNDFEREEYEILTKKIAKSIIRNDDKIEFSESAKMLLIKRSRIIAGAVNKIDALVDIIEKEYQDESHMLVYCGATTIQDYNYEEGHPDNEDKRQIEVVLDSLGNGLDMRVGKFTSEENIEERQTLIDNFSSGEVLQALIAIRCLDEGVNIPSIETAFILASSTNPKEYIQRRGRVLRKYPGKRFAKIYDFVTLPRSIEDLERAYYVENWEKSLIKRELERVDEFSRLAENKSESDKLKSELKEYSGLYYSQEDEFDGFN